jgi:hypothetical protein
MLNLFLGAAAGVAFEYFLDPDMGRRRRNVARDRGMAMFRGAARGLTRRGRLAGASAYGLRQKLSHLQPEDPLPPNDVTLAQKVESEVFRDPALPKGRINVNAQFGTIVLRGEVDRPEQVNEIEAAVKRVPGVRDVENLLHLPGTPTPMT